MIDIMDVIFEGDETCEHEFVSNNNLNSISAPKRICKNCGRVEKIKYIDEFNYLYKKFHSDLGGKNA